MAQLYRSRVQGLYDALQDVHFQRLRATAIVRLIEAGCDSLAVSAMTGHSPRSIDLIAKH